MRLLRAGVTVTVLTSAGRALGFVRTVLTAAWLGAGPAADAFFVAFGLFGLLRAPLAADGVGAAFVPLFSRRLARSGPDAARRFAGQALAAVLVILAVLTGLAALAMPWIVETVTPGFGSDPERLDLAVELARVMLPCLMLTAPALLLRAVLNGLGRFAAGAFLPVLFNLATIAALLGVTPLLGHAAHALAWGVAAAGAAQLGFLALACRRAEFPIPLARPRLGADVRRLFRRAAPAAISAASGQAMLVVDLAVGSLLAAGAVSYLHYAERVAHLVPAIVGGAAATVLLPLLSRGGARVMDATNRTLEAALLPIVPGAAALAVIAEPIAAALFQRGAFGAADAAATATAIGAYAAGLPAWVAVRVLISVCFSRGDTATPMVLAMVGIAVNVAGSLLLLGPLGHAGVALATAIAWWLHGAVLLALLVRRRQFAPDRRLCRRGAALVAATGAMAGVLWLVRGALGADPGAGDAERIATLGILVGTGLVGFVAFAVLTGAARPVELLRAWRHETR